MDHSLDKTEKEVKASVPGCAKAAAVPKCSEGGGGQVRAWQYPHPVKASPLSNRVPMWEQGPEVARIPAQWG